MVNKHKEEYNTNMKKILSSLIGVFMLMSVEQAQWQYLSTNTTIGTTAVNSSLSNNCILISPSNCTWVVDSITIYAAPVYGSTSPFYVNLYDNWYPTNRFHGGPNFTNGTTITSYASYTTNYPMNVGSNSTTYSEGVYVTTTGVTNYMTNTTLYTLGTSLAWYNLSNTISPVFSTVTVPSVSSTFSDLGLTFSKGVMLNTRVSPGVVCSNVVSYTIKYKELFGPTRY